MKRKIESGRDLQLVVFNVSHPGLDDIHRQFLGMLVPFADHGAGGNARPTYDFLAGALHRTAESVRLYARYCESLGLIKLTHQAHGKGNANVFAFCLDHEAYPDSYPTYKPKLAPNSDPISPKRETTLPQTQTRLAPNVGLDPPTALPIHTTTPTTPTPPQPNSIAANEPSAVFRELCGMYLKTEERHPDINKAHKAELMKLIQKNPDEVRAAWAACISVRPYNGETTHPFRYLLEGYDAYVAKAEHQKTKTVWTDATRKAALEAARENALKILAEAQKSEKIRAHLVDEEVLVDDGEPAF